MIWAKLSDAAFYRGIHPRLDLALDHLTPECLAELSDQPRELDERRVYATRFTYETIPLEEGFFEAHRRYLDIHLMLQGEERVDIAHPRGLTLFEQRDDFYGYHGEAEQTLVLRPGSFLVVFPGDAHRIKLWVGGPKSVTKAVFKVLLTD